MRSTCAWSQSALVHGSGSSSDMTLYPHTTRLKVSVCVSEQRECMREGGKKERERRIYRRSYQRGGSVGRDQKSVLLFSVHQVVPRERRYVWCCIIHVAHRLHKL